MLIENSSDYVNLFTLALLLGITGFFAGICAGLFGVGGGIIVVPVLLYFFNFINPLSSVNMHVAIGTSLGVIIVTGLSSALAHYQRKAVDLQILRHWGPWIALGAVLGSLIASQSSGALLIAIFGTFILLIALTMFFTPNGLQIHHTPPQGTLKTTLATSIGLFSSLMGIGGGTFMVPTLSLYGFPLTRAIGTSSAIGLLIAIPGSICFILINLDASDLPPFCIGHFNILGFVLISSVSIFTSPLGAKLAHNFSTQHLRQIFALFLTITGTRLLITAINLT